MPLLSNEQIMQVVHEALNAAVVDDHDAMLAAMTPLWKPNGDVGDGYLFTMALISIVIDSMPRPACPEHGKSCAHLTMGLAPVDPETGGPDMSRSTDITPEYEAEHPAEVAYLRMLAAEYEDDIDATVDLFCVAVQAGHAADVIWKALHNAGDVMRRKRSVLQ